MARLFERDNHGLLRVELSRNLHHHIVRQRRLRLLERREDHLLQSGYLPEMPETSENNLEEASEACSLLAMRCDHRESLLRVSKMSAG